VRKQIVSTISIGGEEFEGVSELLDDGFRFYRFTGIIAKSLQYVKTVYFDDVSSITRERNILKLKLKSGGEIQITITEKDAIAIDSYMQTLEELLKGRLARATAILAVSNCSILVARFFGTVSNMLMSLHGKVDWKKIEDLTTLIMEYSKSLNKVHILVSHELLDLLRKYVIMRDTLKVIDILRRLIINVYNSIMLYIKSAPTATPEWAYLKVLTETLLILETAKLHKYLGNTFEYLRLADLSSKYAEELSKIVGRDLSLKLNYVLSGELSTIDYFNEISKHLRRVAADISISYKL